MGSLYQPPRATKRPKQFEKKSFFWHRLLGRVDCRAMPCPKAPWLPNNVPSAHVLCQRATISSNHKHQQRQQQHRSRLNDTLLPPSSTEELLTFSFGDQKVFSCPVDINIYRYHLSCRLYYCIFTVDKLSCWERHVRCPLLHPFVAPAHFLAATLILRLSTHLFASPYLMLITPHSCLR